jgi:hypothetical protein
MKEAEMRRATQRHYTLDDYFSVEEMSEIKHEYYNGESFALAGASLDHKMKRLSNTSRLKATSGASANIDKRKIRGDLRWR